MLNTLLKKIWEFFKPAALPVFLLISIFLAGRNFLSQFNGERDSFSARLEAMQKIHDNELKKIIDAQAQERERHEQNLKQLQQDLNDAIVKHEEKLKELERQKQEEGKHLFEKYKNDPEGLAQELSRATGIPVYSPKVNGK